jgi:hypothetical protein
MEMCGQFHAPVDLHRRKSPCHQMANPKAGLEAMEKRKISCILMRIEPRFHGCHARSLVANRASYPGSLTHSWN